MNWDELNGSLDFSTLRYLYAARKLRPGDVVRAVYRRIAARGEDHVWIHLVPEEEALAAALRVEATLDPSAPLYGITILAEPFAEARAAAISAAHHRATGLLLGATVHHLAVEG